MRILGIDSSTKVTSLAIIEEEGIIAEFNISSDYKKTSSILVLAIQDLLKKIDLKLVDLDGLAISIGPGSFTGLRVGLGVAKGLSYATSLPLVGVNSLDALAYSYRGVPFLICPVMQCKKDELFFAVFRWLEDLERIIDYQCEDIGSLLKRLSLLKEKIIILGEGARNYGQIIKSELNKKVIFIDDSLNFPGGVKVAHWGLERLKRGERDDPFTLVPLYLRKSQAEVAWEDNQNNNKFPPPKKSRR